MSDRYAEDIRRIVGIDNLASGIDALPAKQPIKGIRGIAYFNADGTIGTDTGDKGDTTQPDDSVDGNEAGNDGDGTGTGDGSGPGNIGDDIIFDPVGDDGIVPIENLFDGTMGIGDSFIGVNGLEDCSTGQDYEIRGDGQFPAPEGWSDADTPPLPDHYEEGYYWVYSGSYGTFTGHDPLTVAQGHWEAYWQGEYGFSTHSYVLTEIYSGGGAYGQGFAVYNFKTSGTGDQLKTATVWRQSCGNSYQAICATLPVESWPVDTPAILSWDEETSAFITNQWDGNVAIEFHANNSGEVVLCDSEGNQYSVAPSKNGGQVFTDIANNVFIVRDKNGKITAVGSGSVRDQYVAK